MTFVIKVELLMRNYTAPGIVYKRPAKFQNWNKERGWCMILFSNH